VAPKVAVAGSTAVNPTPDPAQGDVKRETPAPGSGGQIPGTTTDTTPQAPEEKSLAKSFAALSRKSAAFEQQQRDWRANQAAEKAAAEAWRSERATLVTKAEERDRAAALIAQKDYKGLLDALGIPFNDVAQQVIRDGKRDPIEAVKAFTQQTKEEILNEVRKLQAEKDAATQRELELRAVQNAKGYIGQLMTDNPEKWELAGRFSNPDEVYKVMDDTWTLTQGQKALSYTEALDKVEESLAKKFSESKSQKLRTLLTGEVVSEATKPESQPSQPASTLTTRKPVTEPGSASPTKLTNDQIMAQLVEKAKQQLGR
jgi:hypothetical protein